MRTKRLRAKLKRQNEVAMSILLDLRALLARGANFEATLLIQYIGIRSLLAERGAGLEHHMALSGILCSRSSSSASQ